jgi:glycerol-3-phosphate acyltransferase PlsY
MGWGLVISLLIGYLLGSIPTSYLAGRSRGIDLRKHGSGNLGASNTYRVLGAAYAVPVLLLDIAKGAGAVCLAEWLAVRFGWGPPSWFGGAAALGAIAGHIWTLFLGFRGGKGVATAGGALLWLVPVPALLSIAVCFLLVAATRYVSVGSIAGAALLPLFVYVWAARRARSVWLGPELWLALAVAAVVLATHRSNLRRLLAGTENRLARVRKEAS